MTVRPQYIIVAGVNGAGKSTLYRTVPQLFQDTQRINAYEIDNYFSQMAFYKNGMAAIKGTIDCINSFLKVPIKLKNHTKYFETEIYLKNLQNFGIEVYPLGSSYKDCNVFFFRANEI